MKTFINDNQCKSNIIKSRRTKTSKKQKKFLSLLMLVLIPFLTWDCNCDQLESDVFNMYSSNFYEVKYGDIAGYTKLRDLTRYRYYVLKADGNYTTNYYWTNTIVTNLDTTNFWTTDFTHGSDVITYILRYQRVQAISDSTIANDYAYIQPFSGWNVTNVDNTFYSNNGAADLTRPEKVVLFTNQFINGIYASISRYVGFYSNRKLRSLGAFPGSNAFYQDLLLKSINDNSMLHGFDVLRENPDILFFNDGVSLKWATLATETEIDGVTYEDRAIEFFTNGTVYYGHLGGKGTDAIIDDVQYALQQKIYFYWHNSIADRRIAIAVLENNTRIADIDFSDEAARQFSGEGDGGATYALGNISYYYNGLVKQGILEGDQIIGGTSYEDGTHIRFNEDGTVNSFNDAWNGGFMGAPSPLQPF